MGPVTDDLGNPFLTEFAGSAQMALSRGHPEAQAATLDDLMGLGMLSGVLAVGRTVGRDIRVVGFGDIEECTMTHPPHSSGRRDIAGPGRQTAATRPARPGEDRRPPPESRASVSLVARASSLGA